MALLGKRLAVSIPDTVLEEKNSLRDKTAKLGVMARACAIYGVDAVEVFTDEGGHGEPDLIAKVLRYLETPQYLRKRLFPLDEALRFAGVLPPLKTPAHKPPVSFQKLAIGETREGVVNTDGTVYIGLPETPMLDGKLAENTRITVRIVSKVPFRAGKISKDGPEEYWGYSVDKKTAEEVVTDRRFQTKIATSRLGEPLNKQLPRLRQSVERSAGVKLIFGSPSRGLYQIMGKERLKRTEFVLNLFTEQHVETVRTEEAIFAGLGLVNTILSEKA